MVIPQLKRILVSNEPQSEDDFLIPAIADIGPTDAEGVDYFYFRIMTPKRVLSILEEDKILDGRAIFIINNFDISLVEAEINKILEDCIRPTWDEVAKAINRHLNWEYDNIQYETLEEAMTKLNKGN
ncbi:Imm8 family immunity protein [Paenibacillus sp. NPDC057967]|uniref:Imm8 family immunity protein n=1 Tax=Paenibacillus sp. NPDC057967 TaxID=3346293 RepID=UPI0036DC4AD0